MVFAGLNKAPELIRRRVQDFNLERVGNEMAERLKVIEESL